MTPSHAARLAAALAGIAFPGAAWSAHPLQTEDTGTQGAGNVEFENGLSLTRSGGSRVWLYQPQLSYGRSTSVDLIVQPSWLRQRDDAASPAVRGLGDTNVDAKWRVFGAAPLSFGVRAGLTLPTSQHGLGLPHDRLGVHALAVATYDVAPFTVHGNLGLAHVPGAAGERSTLGHVSAALMWAANERLTWTLDAGADSNTDAARHGWPATLLFGAIYTIRPGLDADVGYLSSIGSSVVTREWLLGLTYRFAP